MYGGMGQNTTWQTSDLSVALRGIYRLSLQQKEALLNLNGIISLGAQIYAHAYFCLNAHKNVSVGPIKNYFTTEMFLFP